MNDLECTSQNLNVEALFNADDFAGDKTILIAVSGGGDSLALLFLLAEYLQRRGQKHRLIAVTVDHALRPEAATEAAYVKRLCSEHQIRHETLVWDFGTQKPQLGVQEKARFGRYQLLAKAAGNFGADIICTAHTLGDQAETYYMRKARIKDEGVTNPAFAVLNQRGLAAMAYASILCQKYRLLRPLLTTTRQQLRDYLQARNISWFDDPSNDDPHYERVRIRQQLNDNERQQASVKALAAADLREELAIVAAKWGQQLVISNADEGLKLDLAALHTQEKLSETDLASLDLLLAYAAAFVAGKQYIACNDPRLQNFIIHLPVWQKGDNPERISVSGAVIEKRQSLLTITKEKRRRLQPKAAAKAMINETKYTKLDSNPFEFIVPSWDKALFLLFKPFSQ